MFYFISCGGTLEECFFLPFSVMKAMKLSDVNKCVKIFLHGPETFRVFRFDQICGHTFGFVRNISYLFDSNVLLYVFKSITSLETNAQHTLNKLLYEIISEVLKGFCCNS